MNTHKVLLAILKKQVAPCLLCITGLFGASSAVYASAVSLGSASPFTVLSASGAVNCTNSTIEGAVSSAVAGTKTSCVQSNGVVSPISQDTQTDFHNAYSTLAVEQCDYTLATLAGQVLEPGTYCVDNASTNTASVLTLNGDEDDTWLFKIGSSGAGALTGTDFVVDMIGGAQACNVTWWVADAVTLTRGEFKGDILAGQAVTVTGVASNSPLKGRIMAEGTVVLTNADALGCVAEAAARTEEAIAAALAAKQAAEEAANVALLAVVNDAIAVVIGSEGRDGLIGDDGATGSQGPIGLTGADGAQGIQGILGVAGADGTDGSDGATGTQGQIGLTGAEGAQGIQGILGVAGADGTDGDDGATGSQGPIGLTGADGAQGIQGILGVAGADGTDGSDGATGAQGQIGLTGAEGAEGPAGLGVFIWNGPPTDTDYDYALGTVWIDTEATAVYILADNTIDDAVWINTAGSGPAVTYAIGDIGPAGGIVFHTTDRGAHGLEAAPYHQANARWGCTDDDVLTGFQLGAGAGNTSAILNTCPYVTSSAADVAASHSQGSVWDWYLPSLDELQRLFETFDRIESGDIIWDGVFYDRFIYGERVWSSTQDGPDDAWARVYGHVEPLSHYKGEHISVRAIRSF